MADITQASEAELLAELERRKKAAQGIPPEPKENPDFSRLTRLILENVTEMVSAEYEEGDMAQYIYEAALEAVYGKEYWDWRNKQDF